MGSHEMVYSVCFLDFIGLSPSGLFSLGLHVLLCRVVASVCCVGHAGVS